MCQGHSDKKASRYNLRTILYFHLGGGVEVGVMFISPQGLSGWLEDPLSSHRCHLPGPHQVLVSGNWPLAQSQEEAFCFPDSCTTPTAPSPACSPLPGTWSFIS